MELDFTLDEVLIEELDFTLDEVLIEELDFTLDEVLIEELDFALDEVLIEELDLTLDEVLMGAALVLLTDGAELGISVTLIVFRSLFWMLDLSCTVQ